ncbi:MAG: hypothetical protein V4812_20035 [Pseudomonadota bacterium]
MKPSKIEFDRKTNDFLVNGKPLLEHLQKHESVVADRYVVSILSQTGACDRLLGTTISDLQEGHVALYLCSHCGGYDGNPIGVDLCFEGDRVIWKDIGYYSDFSDEAPRLFNNVRQYIFDLAQYRQLLEGLKIYEP